MYQNLGGDEAMESNMKSIQLKVLDKLHPDLDMRTYDKAFYYLLLDTKDNDLTLVGKNIFRKDQKMPYIDEIYANHQLTVKLLEENYNDDS